MDGHRFDDLTRALATSSSRRLVLRGLVAGAVGGLFARLSRSIAAQGACASAADCPGDGDPCTAVDCVNGACIDYPVVCDP